MTSAARYAADNGLVLIIPDCDNSFYQNMVYGGAYYSFMTEELPLLLRTIWIFNFPDLIYAMTNGGPAGSSNIITSYMMQLVNNLDYGMASAVGVLCILVELVFAVFYLKLTKYGEED